MAASIFPAKRDAMAAQFMLKAAPLHLPRFTTLPAVINSIPRETSALYYMYDSQNALSTRVSRVVSHCGGWASVCTSQPAFRKPAAMQSRAHSRTSVRHIASAVRIPNPLRTQPMLLFSARQSSAGKT